MSLRVGDGREGILGVKGRCPERNKSSAKSCPSGVSSAKENCFKTKKVYNNLVSHVSLETVSLKLLQ